MVKKKMSKEKREEIFWTQQLQSAFELNSLITKDRHYRTVPEEEKQDVTMIAYIFPVGSDDAHIIRDIESIVAIHNDIHITGRDGITATIIPSGYGVVGDTFFKMSDMVIMFEHSEHGILNNESLGRGLHEMLEQEGIRGVRNKGLPSDS